jgi:hypothetical protein
MRNMSKVLVTSLIGNEDMIDFLCSYRTRDHMHNSKHFSHEKTKKYYPHGGLFWFVCDKNGNPAGPALFIMKVPVTTRSTDTGFKR